MMSKLVSVIVPAYNEEASLLHLYEALKKLMESLPDYDWEILFINDGSKDKTLSIIESLYDTDKRIAYVDLSRNFGKEKAMLAGFDYCKGDCAVMIDADLQDPPYLIKDMLQYWEEGFEDVYAKRKDRGKEPWLRKKLSMMFYNMLDRSTAFCAILYLIWTLIKVAFWGDPVAGFPTLISVILFLGAVQLIAIGILGEYIGRIFNEAKHRPTYLIENYKARRQ